MVTGDSLSAHSLWHVDLSGIEGRYDNQRIPLCHVDVPFLSWHLGVFVYYLTSGGLAAWSGWL